MTRSHRQISSRTLASVAAAVALLVAVVGVAQAQLDTELTPTAKPSTQWTILGGATFDADGAMPDGSITPYTVDFFSTAFSPNGNTGFFGGWECPEGTSFDDLDRCARQPVMYRLSEDENGDRHFDRTPLPTTGGSGFVGAVAWSSNDVAIAVGGTGDYPRRESDAAADPAGTPLAWKYENGSWSEIVGLPADMSALTAVDCARLDVNAGPAPFKAGECLAGGVAQMWWWKPSQGFVGPPIKDVANIATNLPDFEYRVRAIDINAGGLLPYIVAATSGCCKEVSPGEAPTGARVLVYGTAFSGASVGAVTWRSEPLIAGAEEVANSSQLLPDSYYGVVNTGSAGAVSVVASPGGDPDVLEAGSRLVSRASTNLQAGPKGDPDLLDRKLDSLRLLAADGDFSSTQLPIQEITSLGNQPVGDGVVDWAVGRFKDSDQAVAYTTLTSLAPLPSPFTCPDAVTAGADAFFSQTAPNCDLDSGNVTSYSPEGGSRRLVQLPTYALNAFQFVPERNGAEAWAAGDKGAIARLGGEGALGASSEPKAPKLRPGTTVPLSDNSVFDGFRPVTLAQPGTVPSLGSQPVEELERPAVEAYGTSDSTRWWRLRREGIAAMAMSRDGSEGWAVGSGFPNQAPTVDENILNGIVGDNLTLQHFNGERWVKCDMTGLGEDAEPDSACASLKPWLDQKVNGVPRPPVLSAVARIPLERDGDAGNNDDFEAIAVGSSVVSSDAFVVRYINGRWDYDADASKIVKATTSNNHRADIAFVTPDDGWLVTYGADTPDVYHYGPSDDRRGWPHGRWVRCTEVPTPPAECGGLEGVFPPDEALTTDVELEVAGDHVFMAGRRKAAGGTTSQQWFPFVFSKGPDDDGADEEAQWEPELNPGCTDPPECTTTEGPDKLGRVYSVSVAELDDGTVVGWLLGRFGGALNQVPDTAASVQGNQSDDYTRAALGPTHVLMRRTPDGEWIPRDPEIKDAAEDYLPFMGGSSGYPAKLVSFRGPDGTERSFIMPGRASQFAESYSPPLEYDPATDRWEVMPAPWVSTEKTSAPTHLEEATKGVVTAAAPDQQGGLWITGQMNSGQGREIDLVPHRATFFYRYSRSHRKPVFEDTPNPVSEQISGMAGAPDGRLWVSTYSNRLYHYDRIKGWERIQIKGWDPGRIVTNPSDTYAVAVNRDGVGIAVGEEGRIANLTNNGVTLDASAGRRCSDEPPPCGAARDLRAAAVASDGSAIAGGDQLTLVWRPANGEFRQIERPRAAINATVTGLSMPRAGTAWLTLDRGEVWRGDLLASGWRWTRETTQAMAGDERRTREYPSGRSVLNAIGIDSDGRGLAVGDRGAILERSGDGSWRRLDTGFYEHLYSVTLPPGGYGDGTLIGGGLGLIITRVHGEFQVARTSDYTDPLTAGPGQIYTARIVGLALASGTHDGDVEAWAASQVPLDPPALVRKPEPFALLHYASDEDDPLLNPRRKRVRPLPDAPAVEAGELTLAAFGRTECHLDTYCDDFQGSNLFNERVIRGIQADLRKRRGVTDGPMAAVFTGDMANMPGRSQNAKQTAPGINSPEGPTNPNVIQNQWRDVVAKPLFRAGIPVFAAPGKTDLSRVQTCVINVVCTDTQEHADAGLSLQWRQTFAKMPEPWGTEDEFASEDDDVSFDEVPKSGIHLPERKELEGARTHYAFDVKHDGEIGPRMIFIDNSFARSMSAGEASQNPIEPQGGQAMWLDQMLCIRGETCSRGGSRRPGQSAIVVSNAPAYSYGPGGLDSVQADASVLETLLVRHRATAVISGRLGWNGLFYTLGAGLHTPCPGDAYPSQKPTSVDCDVAGAGATPEPPPVPGTGELAESLRGLGAPIPPQVDEALGTTGELTTAIPNVIAASAGGRFGPTGGDDGEAGAGYWHGYSVVRVRKSGEVIVEQRPIFDWIGIEAQQHTLKPGQRMTLRGYGREPLGTDVPARFDRIDSPAITHRYDLLVADEDNPSMPKEDADGNYIPLDSRVATIDEQSGLVKAGRGRQARTYGVALLSVGAKAAAYPLVFEPAKSFQPKVAAVSTVKTPATQQSVPQTQRPIHILPAVPAAAASNPPPQPPVQSPSFGNLQLPAPPTMPSIPPIPSATPTTPPAPPNPPAPPASGEALPLSLQAPVSAVSIVTTVIPPTPPPINPAPPGGSAARKEAKQRQAATAKSEEGGGDPAANPEDAQPRTNMGDSPNSATRLEQAKPNRYSFTAVQHTEQASAWSQTALYGGTTVLMALVLAGGWMTGRPRPRRKDPVVPAPAWNRSRNRDSWR